MIASQSNGLLPWRRVGVGGCRGAASVWVVAVAPRRCGWHDRSVVCVGKARIEVVVLRWRAAPGRTGRCSANCGMVCEILYVRARGWDARNLNVFGGGFTKTSISSTLAMFRQNIFLDWIPDRII